MRFSSFRMLGSRFPVACLGRRHRRYGRKEPRPIGITLRLIRGTVDRYSVHTQQPQQPHLDVGRRKKTHRLLRNMASVDSFV